MTPTICKGCGKEVWLDNGVWRWADAVPHQCQKDWRRPVANVPTGSTTTTDRTDGRR